VSYDLVEGDGLRTSYAFAPLVTVSVKPDGPARLQLEFASSPVYRDNQEFRVTRLSFDKVAAYCWNDFEFHRQISNDDDVEFSLIEVTDSNVVAELRATGRPLPGLHHYRISFDDHGTYDVICEKLEISHAAAADAETYP
jgi:hypothetical protein